MKTYKIHIITPLPYDFTISPLFLLDRKGFLPYFCHWSGRNSFLSWRNPTLIETYIC